MLKAAALYIVGIVGVLFGVLLFLIAVSKLYWPANAERAGYDAAKLIFAVLAVYLIRKGTRWFEYGRKIAAGAQ